MILIEKSYPGPYCGMLLREARSRMKPILEIWRGFVAIARGFRELKFDVLE